MEDYRVLKFLDLFKGIFERFGIDYKAMRKILQVKLLLDSRRVATVLQNSKANREENKDKNNFIKSLGMYLLLGFLMIPIVIFGQNYLFQMSIVMGMFMFFMMTSLISDFSSVLLDLKDKNILLSKPINNRTLNMAKIIHIFFYVFMTTMAMMGPALIASLIKNGVLFFFIFLMEIILIDLFLIVVTGLVYLLILRFFDGEKLKDIINYVQIGLTLTLSIGYQMISRIFQFVDFDTVKFTNKWWTYLLTPVWFAGSFEFFIRGNRDGYIVAYTIMAFIIPIVSIIVYIKLMPEFERNLQKLTSAGKAKKNKDRLTGTISRLICKTKEERNFYRFATNMMKNERTFKLKVYPSLGMGFIFPFLILLSFSYTKDISQISQGSIYFTMYFSYIIIPAVLQFLGYSGDYKGAWIYETFPIDYWESIYRGTVKAAFINLFTPIFILISIIFLIVFKLSILPHIIIVYLNMMLSICILFMISEKNLPFSRAFEVSEGRSGFMAMILSFITIGCLGGAHYLIGKMSYGAYIYILISIVANMVFWKYAFRVKTA
ncbi:MAG: hypothetical protein AB2375_04520 [Tissierellaceae bacterium]